VRLASQFADRRACYLPGSASADEFCVVGRCRHRHIVGVTRRRPDHFATAAVLVDRMPRIVLPVAGPTMAELPRRRSRDHVCRAPGPPFVPPNHVVVAPSTGNPALSQLRPGGASRTE